MMVNHFVAGTGPEPNHDVILPLLVAQLHGELLGFHQRRVTLSTHVLTTKIGTPCWLRSNRLALIKRMLYQMS